MRVTKKDSFLFLAGALCGAGLMYLYFYNVLSHLFQ